MKRPVKIALIIIGVLGALTLAGRLFLHVIATGYARTVKLDEGAFARALKHLPDGEYTAESHHKGYMAVKLSVQVKGHRINHVEIHKHSTGRKRSEQVLKRVVAAQSLKVDAVSGATASSKMLLKTIEKALLSAVSQQPGHKQSPSPGQPVAPPNG